MNTKQLRQKILDLAIKGKLVPQDPNDEPASKLLERIREEKEQLIKDGKLKRDKNESYIFVGDDKLHYEKFADGSVVCIEDEIPFEIPESWAWCRLKEVCKYIQRGKSPKYSEEKRFPVISQKCVRWTGVDFKPMKYITEESLKNYETVRFLCDGDILWNSTGTGTVGRAALYISKLNPFSIAVVDSHVTVLRPLKVLSDYIHKYIISPHVQIGFEDLCDGSTNQKELSLTTVCNFLIPIPPLKEQSRISSTVQELLEIIDAVENDKIDLSELIKQTKAKVLDLAIRGKLVPQDPNDEPADKLLEKIREEKEQLIKKGKIKRDKNETFIYKNSDDNSYYEQIDGETICIDDDLPFEIPDSWRWCRLNNFSLYSTDYVANGSFASLKQNVSIYKTPNYALLIKTQDFANNFTKDLTYIDKQSYEFLYKSKLFGGELMLSNIGASIGKVFIIPDLKCPMNIAPNSIIVKFLDSVTTKYIYFLIQSYFGQSLLKDFTAGTAMPKFNKTQLRENLLPYPSYAEQKRIVDKIENIFSYLDNLESIIKGS